MPVPITTITVNGVTVPAYADVYNSLVAQAQQIFGPNIYLGNDSQDGQILGVFAQAISDANNAVAAAYNAFSPATAQGAGLSSNVKINGLQRILANNSTVPMLISGNNGASIVNGIVSDGINQWALPSPTVIPPAGFLTVTATAVTAGAIQAATGTITTIVNPQNGWTGATNSAAATVGNPVEADGALRERQAFSTALPSQTILQGLVGALAAIPGVLQTQVYENDTNATNANGVPAGAIAPVLLGGSALTIGQTIALKKSLGCPTYGSTAETFTNASGTNVTINFSFASQQQIGVAITIKNKGAYNTNIGTEIQNAVSAAINTYNSNIVAGTSIGATLSFLQLGAVAQLPGTNDGQTYRLEAISIGPLGGTLAAADYAVAWNAVPVCQPSNVTIMVT